MTWYINMTWSYIILHRMFPSITLNFRFSRTKPWKNVSKSNALRYKFPNSKNRNFLQPTYTHRHRNRERTAPGSQEELCCEKTGRDRNPPDRSDRIPAGYVHPTTQHRQQPNTKSTLTLGNKNHICTIISTVLWLSVRAPQPALIIILILFCLEILIGWFEI